MRTSMFKNYVGIVTAAICLLGGMTCSIFAQGGANIDEWGEVFGGTPPPRSNNARIAQKPAVVVGAVGQDPKPGLRKALETQIKEAFVKDGRYTAVTREEAVLTAVDNEQAHQRTGAVDDAQVRQIGKQSGAKYVCVVEIAPLMNSYTLSAQFVDIESANIVSMASVTNMLRNPGDFLAASEELVRKLLGYTQQTPTAAATQKTSVKHVAVIETKIDERSATARGISSADLGEITTVLRREAVKNLPKDKFKVMTSETVQSMGAAMVQDCADENCIVTIGSKIGADYIVRGTLSKIRERYSLTVELFETEYGNLVAVTSEPIRSADLDDLIDKTPAGSATMYKSFAGTGTPVAAQAAAAPTPITNVAAPVVQQAQTVTYPPPAVPQVQAAGTATQRSNEAEFHNSNGKVLMKSSVDRAIAAFSNAIQHDPYVAEYYVNRGNAYLRKKEYRLAVMDFEAALRIKPNNKSVWKLLERAQKYANRRGNAIGVGVGWVWGDSDLAGTDYRLYYQFAAGKRSWIEVDVFYSYLDNSYCDGYYDYYYGSSYQWCYDKYMWRLGTTFTYKWYWNVSNNIYFHLGPSIGIGSYETNRSLYYGEDKNFMLIAGVHIGFEFKFGQHFSVIIDGRPASSYRAAGLGGLSLKYEF